MHLSFNSLIAQERAKKLLKKSFHREKMSHAYLFRGPAGVGKKRCALTFAAYINCLSPVDQDVCGNCSSCIKFRSGNHPDLLLIQPEGIHVKINQVRELKHRLTYPPFEAMHRVVLFEDIHNTMCRKEVANSLLKTLEEPPENTILILTADEAGDILATIVSRCQVIPFHALPYDLVSKALMFKNEISEENAATLAAVAEGSLGRAKLLLKKNLLSFRREIVERLLRLSKGRPESVEIVFNLAETAAKLKENLYELLDLIKVWLRDLILLATGASESMIISRDLFPFMEAAQKRWNLKELSDRLTLIDKAGKQLDRNCNRALVCEALFFGLL
ncbi:MAG: DNA polymerase III subunit delta' [Thermodesulfobacteriota bacterium]|nr:DNA polymerase III subunit delta' [Thermodesulfobacteriota bacterium]